MKATARGFRSDLISGYVFVAPAVALFAVFQIYPLFRTAVLSFQEFIGSAFVGVGLKNYAELLSDKVFARSLLNSALFVALNLPLILAFTLFVSYRIYQAHRALLGFYRIAFYLPSVASIVTISVVWKNLLNPVMGLANYLAGLAGLAPITWLGQGYAFGSLTFILFTINVGMSLILYIAAMQNIPAALIEAARIDGAGQPAHLLHHHLSPGDADNAFRGGHQHHQPVPVLCPGQPDDKRRAILRDLDNRVPDL